MARAVNSAADIIAASLPANPCSIDTDSPSQRPIKSFRQRRARTDASVSGGSVLAQRRWGAKAENNTACNIGAGGDPVWLLVWQYQAAHLTRLLGVRNIEHPSRIGMPQLPPAKR